MIKKQLSYWTESEGELVPGMTDIAAIPAAAAGNRYIHIRSLGYHFCLVGLVHAKDQRNTLDPLSKK
jgi:hypothetical protein